MAAHPQRRAKVIAAALRAESIAPQVSQDEMVIAAAQSRLAARTCAEAHAPSLATQSLVRIWSEIGCEPYIIARELGISTKKLEALYPDEIANGEYTGVARVMQALYGAANSGDVSAMINYIRFKGSRTPLVDNAKADAPDIIVQLDLVKSITSSINALRAGAGQPMIEARRVEPDADDGSDLI